MPRSCTVCEHPDREAIDEALVAGESSAVIAGRYRTIGERAIRRHRTNHLPEKLAKAHEAEEVARADSLLEQVRDLQERALDILDQAEEAGELRTALGAIREARGNLELLAKLLGELSDQPQVNVLVSPEWLELRAVIVTALEPHPQALRAVVGALESGGNGSARWGPTARLGPRSVRPVSRFGARPLARGTPPYPLG
jgi:hypothetical protein